MEWTPPQKQGALKVKYTRLLATVVATLVAIAGINSTASAQQAPGSVAIIDLSYIFKNHTRFKAMTEDMRASVTAAEEQLKKGKTDIDALSKRLVELGNDFRKDSPEYKQLDADITKRKIDLNAAIAIQKKDFLEKEAKIYYSVYSEIIDEVQYFAERNGISLVLRFNGDPANDSDPQEILKQLNKSVVYYSKRIDITPMVLDSINARNGAGRPPVNPGTAQPPQRPGVGVPLPRR
jgi:outer membrane protein